MDNRKGLRRLFCLDLDIARVQSSLRRFAMHKGSMGNSASDFAYSSSTLWGMVGIFIMIYQVHALLYDGLEECIRGGVF